MRRCPEVPLPYERPKVSYAVFPAIQMAHHSNTKMCGFYSVHTLLSEGDCIGGIATGEVNLSLETGDSSHLLIMSRLKIVLADVLTVLGVSL